MTATGRERRFLKHCALSVATGLTLVLLGHLINPRHQEEP